MTRIPFEAEDCQIEIKKLSPKSDFDSLNGMRKYDDIMCTELRDPSSNFSPSYGNYCCTFESSITSMDPDS